MWVVPNCSIILETFSPLYAPAYDFLIAIAEPTSRPELINEYVLTPASLYAAVSVGLQTDEILEYLERFSKTHLPAEIQAYVRLHTKTYGSVMLILRENKYFIESHREEVLQKLLTDEGIQSARVHRSILSTARPAEDSAPASSTAANAEGDSISGVLEGGDDEGEAAEEGRKIHSFEVAMESIKMVKQRCLALEYPLLEEYDYRNDHLLPELNVNLKSSTMIRPYQEKALSKMFGDGRARSGIIVLPCGAGKTLVGITACATIKKNTLIFCSARVAVDQWCAQFKQWTTLDESRINKITPQDKRISEGPGVTITTYSMVSGTKNRNAETRKAIRDLQQREWGLLLLDEVHMAPATSFQAVITSIAAHTKLGLTATLLREDDRIAELEWLIGPKLFEPNWLDLVKGGFLARVQCATISCPMNPRFFSEYLAEPNEHKRRIIAMMNPPKLQACQFLIWFHEKRGDKILVFCDDQKPLRWLADTFQRNVIYGKTPHRERLELFEHFKESPTATTVFLSKVGDDAIDLPQASVIIQVSSQFGSRRQEVQRLGRILRPKVRQNVGEGASAANAFFYSLVSPDTNEVYFATKRQQFLIDQGYSFKQISQLPFHPEFRSQMLFQSPQQQEDLLRIVKENLITDPDEDDSIPPPIATTAPTAARPPHIIRQGNPTHLSGAGGRDYSTNIHQLKKARHL